MPRKLSFLVSGFGIILVGLVAFFDSYAQSIPHIGTFEFFSHVYNLVSLLILPFCIGGSIALLMHESISWQYVYTALLAQHIKRFVINIGSAIFLHKVFSSLGTSMYSLIQNGYNFSQVFLLFGTRAVLSLPLLVVMIFTMPFQHVALYIIGGILFVILCTSVFQLWASTNQIFQARQNNEIVLSFWKQRSWRYYFQAFPRISLTLLHEIIAPVSFGVILTAVVFSAIAPDVLRLLFGFPFEGAIVAVLLAFFPFEGIIGFVLMFGMYQLHHNVGTLLAFVAASFCWQLWFSPQLLKTIPNLRKWLSFALVCCAILGWAVNLYGG
jgi:hypothetical protein